MQFGWDNLTFLRPAPIQLYNFVFDGQLQPSTVLAWTEMNSADLTEQVHIAPFFERHSLRTNDSEAVIGPMLLLGP